MPILSNEASVDTDGDLWLTRTSTSVDGASCVRQTWLYRQMVGRRIHGFGVSASTSNLLYMMYTFVQQDNSNQVLVFYGAALLPKHSTKQRMRKIARGRLQKAPQVIQVPADEWVVKDQKEKALRLAVLHYGMRGARIPKGRCPPLDCAECQQILVAGWDDKADAWVCRQTCRCVVPSEVIA